MRRVTASESPERARPRLNGSLMTDTPIVEDLFLTDTFLIKGRIAKKYQRLSRMLEEVERAFIPIEDATMVSLVGDEVIRTPKVLVAMREIVFAHELVEVAGDEAQRGLAEATKDVQIRAFYNGGVQIELSGLVEAGAYEPQHAAGRSWFIMQKPRLRGLDLDGRAELSILKRLDYAIVRKARLSYIYDFSS